MTARDVEERLAEIRRLAHDDEIAHIREDDLFYDVLTAIAAGDVKDVRAVAALALTSSEIEFARYHA